jgi:hypothetical protein
MQTCGSLFQTQSDCRGHRPLLTRGQLIVQHTQD